MSQQPATSGAPPALDPNVGAIGGQALVEGVMMRRADHWAAAVRCDDGSVKTTAAEVNDLGVWRKIPLARGAIALVESVALGMRALLWAASERATEEDEAPTKAGLAISAVLAVLLSVSIFGVGPAAVARWLGPKSSLAFNVIEGLVRMGLLFAYLLLLSTSAEIRRTFAYHGAEHMAIHALEHGQPLTPEHVRQFDRRHPRCGTSFLVVTVLTAIVVFSLLGRPSLLWLVISRIALLPVVAGLSYEAIRFAGNHRHSWYGRALMAPGSLVQTITTRPPDDEQIEVAVAALEAVLAVSPVVAPGRAPVAEPPRPLQVQGE
jgi:uncharacterized protein YqhQ